MQPEMALRSYKESDGGRAPPGGYGDIYTYSATHGVFKTSDVT